MNTHKKNIKILTNCYFSDCNKFDILRITNKVESFLGIVFFEEIKQENHLFVQSPKNGFWYFCFIDSLESYDFVKQGNLFDKNFIELKEEIFKIFKNARND